MTDDGDGCGNVASRGRCRCGSPTQPFTNWCSKECYLGALAEATSPEVEN